MKIVTSEHDLDPFYQSFRADDTVSFPPFGASAMQARGPSLLDRRAGPGVVFLDAARRLASTELALVRPYSFVTERVSELGRQHLHKLLFVSRREFIIGDHWRIANLIKPRRLPV